MGYLILALIGWIIGVHAAWYVCVFICVTTLFVSFIQDGLGVAYAFFVALSFVIPCAIAALALGDVDISGLDFAFIFTGK